MIAIGFGLAWAGYAVGMWGYCLVRDYNVTFADLFKATWPGASAASTSTAKAATSKTAA